MNPITQELEILGFNWNSRLGAYVYKNNANVIIYFEEVKLLRLERIKKFARRKILDYKKEKKKNGN